MISTVPRITALLFVFAAALLGTGCASKPETRIVDATGSDPTKFYNDLGECRRWASSFELDRAVTQASSALGGAIVGGLLNSSGGVQGIFDGSAARGMQRGADVGMVGGTLATINTQSHPAVSQRVEPLVVDCMRDRGHHIVDGSKAHAAVHPMSFVPTAAGGAPASATHPAPAAAQAVRTAVPTTASAAAQVPASTTTASALPAAGRERARADRFARLRACSVPVAPWEAGMGANYETYSTGCKNGARLFIRCERGTCRELK